MNTPTNFATAAVTRTDIEQVVRQARAERAEVIRTAAHDFAAAIKRMVSAVRPQAPHAAA